MILTSQIGYVCFLVLCFPEHHFHARGSVRALAHGSLHVLRGFVVACSGAFLVQFALWLLCSCSCGRCCFAVDLAVLFDFLMVVRWAWSCLLSISDFGPSSMFLGSSIEICPVFVFHHNIQTEQAVLTGRPE